LVCFRLKGSDDMNKKLLSTINESGQLHMVPASVNDNYVIRFCVCAQNATDEDIGNYIIKSLTRNFNDKIITEYAWRTIKKQATELIVRMKLQVN